MEDGTGTAPRFTETHLGHARGSEQTRQRVLLDLGRQIRAYFLLDMHQKVRAAIPSIALDWMN